MAGQLTIGTIDTGVASTPPVFKANGTEIGQLCKAWANFGYVASAIVINKSFNVSSITYSASGTYIVSFTNAMPDANYAVTTSISTGKAAGTQNMTVLSATSEGLPSNKTASQVSLSTQSISEQQVYFAVFG